MMINGLSGGKLEVLGCDLDLRKQLIDNIRAISKVKLNLKEVGMGVRNAATHNMAGLTTSLLHINCHWQARPGPVSQDSGVPAVIQLWNTSFIADSQ